MRSTLWAGRTAHLRDDDSAGGGDQAGRTEVIAKDVRDNIVLSHGHPLAPGKIVFRDRSTGQFVMSANEIGGYAVQGGLYLSSVAFVCEGDNGDAKIL